MFTKLIKKLFNSPPKGFPRYQTNVWYNYSIWSEEKYPIVFNDTKSYIDCYVGLKVVMGVTTKNKKVYYTVSSIKQMPGGDWYYPSDSIHCNLTFSHIEK